MLTSKHANFSSVPTKLPETDQQQELLPLYTWEEV